MTTTEEQPKPRTYTAQEAADLCGVNKKTILRKAVKLRELGARQDENGYWQITTNHMIGLGLTPGAYKPHDPLAVLDDPVPDAPSTPASLATLTDLAVAQAELRTARVRINEMDAELRELREERATFRARAEAAEARAAERMTIDEFAQRVVQLRPRRWYQSRPQITAGPAPQSTV